jgi:hypothetical protein
MFALSSRKAQPTFTTIRDRLAPRTLEPTHCRHGTILVLVAVLGGVSVERLPTRERESTCFRTQFSVEDIEDAKVVNSYRRSLRVEEQDAREGI